MNIRSRKGSYTVYVTIFFSGMLILIFAVLKSAAAGGIASTTENFGRLWGTSILAEFDINLQKRYGIYGFLGEESLLEEKLNKYAAYSFDEQDFIEYDGAHCSLDGYSLCETEIMKKQMSDAVLALNQPEPLYRDSEANGGGYASSDGSGSAGSAGSLGSTGSAGGSGGSGGFSGETSQFGQRRITSSWILQNLPSAGSRDEVSVTEAVEKIKKGLSLEAIAGKAAVNQYILRFFRHYRSDESVGDTYFQNEIEYILTGIADDARARKKVKQKLVLLRNGLNLAYLYSSPEKREGAMAVAAALTPGPEAVLTQAALLELWAFAEAENDVALLYEDEKVPFLKSDSTWALTLENAMAASDGLIRPSVEEGYEYEEYIRVLLNLIPEETRILRAMDLIQINMKYLYDGAFRLKDYYTGLRYTLDVNGREYEFNECYARGSEVEGESDERVEEDE